MRKKIFPAIVIVFCASCALFAGSLIHTIRHSSTNARIDTPASLTTGGINANAEIDEQVSVAKTPDKKQIPVEQIDPSAAMLESGNTFMVCVDFVNSVSSQKKGVELVGTLSPDHTLFFCGGLHKRRCCIAAYKDSDDVREAAQNAIRITDADPKAVMDIEIHPDKYVILHRKQ